MPEQRDPAQLEVGAPLDHAEERTPDGASDGAPSSVPSTASTVPEPDDSVWARLWRIFISTWDPFTNMRISKPMSLLVSRRDLKRGSLTHDLLRGGMLVPAFAGLEIYEERLDDADDTGALPTAKRASQLAREHQCWLVHERDGQLVTVDDKYIIVHWDGHDDRELMLNQSLWMRLYVMVLTGFCTLCSVITSSIIGSAMPLIQEKFGTSRTVTKTAVFVFVGMFWVGPLVWMPLSELYGRRFAFIFSFLGFTLMNIGCMLAHSWGSLITCRILAGGFASFAMTIGAPVNASVWSLKYLQLGITLYTIAPTAGQALGPLVMGFMADAGLSWRWPFAVAAMFSGALLILLIFTMPETLDAVRLRYKARRLRRETGDMRFIAPIELRRIRRERVVYEILLHPWQMFTQEPVLIAVALYVAYAFGVVCMLSLAYGVVFMQQHSLSSGMLGVTFQCQTAAIVLAAVLVLATDNRLYVKQAEAQGGKPLAPERRLYVMFVGALLFSGGMFWFAWTSYSSVSIWATLVGSGTSMAGIFLVILSSLTYLTETYTVRSANALAITITFQSFFGLGCAMFVEQLYDAVNPRWGGTVLAFISVVFVPVPIVLWWWGPAIRTASKNALSPEPRPSAALPV